MINNEWLIICTRINRINGDPTDFYDQNLKDLENSLSRQLTEKIKSLSSVMKELKITTSKNEINKAWWLLI